MTDNSLPLLMILIIGLISGNSLITGAAAILLFIKSTGFTNIIILLEENSLQIGLIFLTMAILAPIAGGKITSDEIFSSIFTIPGILAIIGGAMAAYISRHGIFLLSRQPQVVSGLILGTIIGVIILKGIPVGPLAAAGITALLLKIIGYR